MIQEKLPPAHRSDSQNKCWGHRDRITSTLTQIMSFLWRVTHQCSPRRKKLQQKPRSLLLLQRQEKPLLPPFRTCATEGLLQRSWCQQGLTQPLLICLVRLKSPSAMKDGGCGRGERHNFPRVKSQGAATGYLWFPIPGYQRDVKCICTKTIPVALPQ